MLDRIPVMTYYHEPEYPRFADRAGLEGTVWVMALISSTGAVEEVRIGRSSGTASLDLAATSAAWRCEWRPGIQNAQPVAVWVSYKVEFKLS
jgi:protein TonB